MQTEFIMTAKTKDNDDLPLMSNAEQILVDHYVLFLKCIFEEKIFKGRVYVFLNANLSSADSDGLHEIKDPNNDFRVTLDSRDIIVEKVEEIILDGNVEGISDHVQVNGMITCMYGSHFAERTVENALHLDKLRRNDLHFEVEEWCLTFWKDEINSPQLFSRLVCITYQTTPQGESITWVKDQDDRECCFTHGAWINNRAFLPCQEPPIAMATWQAFISAPCHATVIMSGDEQSRMINSQESIADNLSTCYFYTRMKMPMSTLAIAIGFWQINGVIFQSNPNEPQRDNLTLMDKNVGEEYCYQRDGVPSDQVIARIIAPPTLLDKVSQELGSCLPQYLQAATELLGPYPFKRLDLVIMPRCFDSLGMASPNVTFISQSILAGDGSMCVHLAHEISHAWFGLLIGALDWTEEWLSEGFATYMEDLIHARAMKWTLEMAKHWSELRTYLRYRTLTSELQVTSAELQTLRINQDDVKACEMTSTSYIKHGMNAEKRFMQVHYLKGYFLLKQLSDLVGQSEFNEVLKAYVKNYHGQLVHSQKILNIFFNHFPDARSEDFSVETLQEQWLNSPGLPKIYLDYTPSPTNPLYNNILIQLKWWRNFNRCQSRLKKVGKKAKNDFSELVELNSEQTVLLLELLLEEARLYSRTLQSLCEFYKLESKNANIRHRWCELVIKHLYHHGLPAVKDFLLNDQGMGVYLYGELMLSEKLHLQQLAKESYMRVESELSSSALKVVQEMLSI